MKKLMLTLLFAATGLSAAAGPMNLGPVVIVCPPPPPHNPSDLSKLPPVISLPPVCGGVLVPVPRPVTPTR
jgi:hypothetical protein